MRALLIVNPHATSTTPAGRDLIALALSSALKLRVAHTAYRGHAAELAAEAASDGYPLIIVHGGDGTVNEVVNGVLGGEVLGGEGGSMASIAATALPTIAVVPGGSANVFARSLGIKNDPLDAANQLISLVQLRHHRRIGLGHCDGRWFLFNAGMGLDAHVVESVEASRAGGKTATSGRYVRATVRTFIRERKLTPALTVETPDGAKEEGVYYAFVSNASPWTYLDDRPVYTNPGADYDSGLGVFALKTARWMSTLRIARQLVFPRRGGPRHRDLLRIDDVKEIRITSSRPIGLQLDGDFVGLRENVTFRATPNMLDVVAPKNPA
ncbi:diacylglycerol/lipid kinase family protein [Hoyosella altamirensis]|uniref:Diacylglycerol kinase family enzyme n=1 Tax=Hoyosella altamirensis TaxID=616997 RepID=A0A839RGX4_9ACTN|nr:diacylglycerol kinase family protein [Hoyosella altamirensis]MBB3035660.1 diacylglycerol kinase family enzyme [Hoyosella altamirensis]